MQTDNDRTSPTNESDLHRLISTYCVGITRVPNTALGFSITYEKSRRNGVKSKISFNAFALQRNIQTFTQTLTYKQINRRKSLYNTICPSFIYRRILYHCPRTRKNWHGRVSEIQSSIHHNTTTCSHRHRHQDVGLSNGIISQVNIPTSQISTQPNDTWQMTNDKWQMTNDKWHITNFHPIQLTSPTPRNNNRRGWRGDFQQWATPRHSNATSFFNDHQWRIHRLHRRGPTITNGCSHPQRRPSVRGSGHDVHAVWRRNKWQWRQVSPTLSLSVCLSVCTDM